MTFSVYKYHMPSGKKKKKNNKLIEIFLDYY